MTMLHEETDEQFLKKFIERTIRTAEPGFGVVGIRNTNNSAFALYTGVSLYKVPLGTKLPNGSKVGSEYVEFNTFTYTKPSHGEIHKVSKFFEANTLKWVWVNPR